MELELRLRPLTAADIDDELCAWYRNDDGHLQYFTGSGRSFDKDTLLEDFTQGIQTARWYYYIIESTHNQRIGTVKIGSIDTRNKTSDLVCLIGNRAFVGKGIGSRAIALANKIAFDEHDIRRLQGGMYASNHASINAYTRAGWVVEAVFKGYYWVDGKAEDRVCVASFNPRYFPTLSTA